MTRIWDLIPEFEATDTLDFLETVVVAYLERLDGDAQEEAIRTLGGIAESLRREGLRLDSERSIAAPVHVIRPSSLYLVNPELARPVEKFEIPDNDSSDGRSSPWNGETPPPPPAALFGRPPVTPPPLDEDIPVEEEEPTPGVYSVFAPEEEIDPSQIHPNEEPVPVSSCLEKTADKD